MNDYNKIHENVSQGIDKEALDQLCNKLGLDEGGDLADILNALAENSGGGGEDATLTLTASLPTSDYDTQSIDAYASKLGIPNEQVFQLLNGDYEKIKYPVTSGKASGFAELRLIAKQDVSQYSNHDQYVRYIDVFGKHYVFSYNPTSSYPYFRILVTNYTTQE